MNDIADASRKQTFLKTFLSYFSHEFTEKIPVSIFWIQLFLIVKHHILPSCVVVGKEIN